MNRGRDEHLLLYKTMSKDKKSKNRKRTMGERRTAMTGQENDVISKDIVQKTEYIENKNGNITKIIFHK